MALEAMPSSSSNDLFTFLIYESFLCGNNESNTLPFNFSNVCSTMLEDHLLLDNLNYPTMDSITSTSQPPLPFPPPPPPPQADTSYSFDKPQMRSRSNSHRQAGNQLLGVVQQESKQVRKRRRRRPKACKNKEEAETQRMTHIVVERNRRKQMNDHLAELKSLMPVSYTQRGDQASIVGGAIEYVKELEHRLQSFQAQKLLLLKQDHLDLHPTVTTTSNNAEEKLLESQHPFSDFFSHPQYTWCMPQHKSSNAAKASLVADIEVTLTESHAKVRILTRRYHKKLSNLIAGFQLLNLSILHLGMTSVLDTLVMYSISAKVEEGCQLTSADDIADATHHMLTRIVEEAAAIC